MSSRSIPLHSTPANPPDSQGAEATRAGRRPRPRATVPAEIVVDWHVGISDPHQDVFGIHMLLFAALGEDFPGRLFDGFETKPETVKFVFRHVAQGRHEIAVESVRTALFGSRTMGEMSLGDRRELVARLRQGISLRAGSGTILIALDPVSGEGTAVPRIRSFERLPLSDRIRAVVGIADEVAPKPKPARPVDQWDIPMLRSLLTDVKDQDVGDKAGFVDAVNRLLRATKHRIRLPDGRLALLKLSKPQGPPGYIQFATRGSAGRLGKVDIKVLSITAEKRANRYLSWG